MRRAWPFARHRLPCSQLGSPEEMSCTAHRASCPLAAEGRRCTQRQPFLTDAQREDCKHIHQRVAGHVYCLERILREVIDDVGFEKVGPRVVGANREIMSAIAKGKG